MPMMPLRCLLVWMLLVTGAVAADDGPIRIGVVGPLSGASSTDMGQSILGGARVFADEVNRTGGLLGRQIELVVRDDKATPALGVQIAHELIEKEKVVATVGYANTGVALPSSKVFQEAKVPLIVTVATGAQVTRQFADTPVKYVFRMGASDALQPVALLNDLAERRKIDKIAILHDDTPYGQFGRDGVVAEMARRQIAPVAIESFKVGDKDMSAQLARARDAGARAILLYGLATEGAAVANSAARMKLNLPIVGSWPLSQQAFIEHAGSAGEGVRMAVTYIDNDLASDRVDFSRAYHRLNQGSRIPSPPSAAQTYDALRLLFLAIFSAGSTDGDAIRTQLEDLRWSTKSTLITRYERPFTPEDHEAITLNMIVMGEVHDGKVVFAYREDANASLIKRIKARQ